MGKVKKGKKLDYEDEADEQIEVERTPDDDVSSKAKKKEKRGKEVSPTIENDSDDESLSKQKKKKDKKKSKGDDVDGATESLQQLTISKGSKKDKKKGKGDISDEEDEDIPKPAKKKGGKKAASDSEDEAVGGGGRKGKASAFSMLAVSDGEDESPEPQSDQSDEDTPKPQPKQDAKKAPPAGKKGKRKKKDDDEDLDQILAELEMEYSGQPVVKAEVNEEPKPEPPKDEPKGRKKDKKKDETPPPPPAEEMEEGDQDGDEVKTVKSAAQKKKEKKEREKQKRMAEKMAEKSKPKESSVPPPEEKEKSEPVEPSVEPDDDRAGDDDEDDDDKKKKKKKKGAKEEKEKKGKGTKKLVAAIQEAQRKLKEEEERLRLEEEERIRKEEEAEQARLDALRLEQEKKDKKKAKEKERKERLKAEGKLLTAKQKADKARAEEMIRAMQARFGDAAVLPGAKPPKKEVKKKKSDDSIPPQPQLEQQSSTEEKANDAKIVEVEIVDKKAEDTPVDDVKDSWDADEDDVKDAWDADSGDESVTTAESKADDKKEVSEASKGESGETKEDKSDADSDSGSDSDSDSDDSDHEEKKTDAERKREKALARIKTRQEEAEKKRTLDELRAAVVCVLGHVDTGKTKILDKLRRTNVQDGEAGGITQQIGATNVPLDCIREQTKHVKGFSQIELKVPGLLIIDTPGHESFSNLRSRGSSLCDIAILVVDIMHGLEPQTIESLNLLKHRKTPFIVALNKIDRLYDWQTMNRKDIRDVIKAQAPNTQLEFEQRAKEVIIQFAEQGMNAALFYDNPDIKSYVSLVPTSAITGEGMGNLLALIIDSCQNLLARRLMFSEELQATVLEVKAISGLGTTIDVILVNGYLRESDTIVLAGTDAPIVTQIRSLLMPQPLKELRVKNAYVEFKEVKAAQGVKIAAKDLEKVIAGLNLRVAYKPDEVDILKEEVSKELKSALSKIKLQERGVYVQASTLGSLEALLEFLKTSSIPYANIRIGPVVKKDVMKASTMLEHDSQYATILAFDVKIERDAQELADSLGVRIFQADIIYHLFDKFMAYREELKRRKREEFKSIAVFPCKLRILPQFVFNSRDPIVVGVIVEAGVVKEGTPICVPSKEFVEIGIVTSIEVNHKNQETARKGQEVCIKIEPIPGEAPKMFGRHFDEKDILVSKISRQSIDACKDYFREDLVKTDWQLMVELKKLFQIL